MRRSAAEALGRIGPQAAQAERQLSQALQDKNAEVRHKAAEALKRIR